MNLSYTLKLFFLTLIAFLGIDFVWLSLVAKKFYDRQLEPFRRTLNWPAVILIYLILVAGVLLFVLPKASGKPALGFFWGAIFGLIAYGVYDLTNFATLADWSLKMVIVDMLWGGFLCGMVSLMAVFLSALLK